MPKLRGLSYQIALYVTVLHDGQEDNGRTRLEAANVAVKMVLLGF